MVRALAFLFATSLFAQIPSSTGVTFTPAQANPAFVRGVESTILMDQVHPNQCDMWFHWWAVDSVNLYYSVATNPTCDNWSTPVAVLTSTGSLYYPYVFRDAASGIYYLLVINGSISGDLFMYQSTNNGLAWTIMNGGNPVLTHSNDFSSRRHLYNTSATILNGTIHLLIETTNADDGAAYREWTAYSSATLANLNFNTNFTPVAQFAVNPDLHYIPERNAFLVFHGDVQAGQWDVRIRATCASLTSNLTLPTTWQRSSNFMMAIDGADLADPSVVDTGGIANGHPSQLMMSYNYDQLRHGDLWQAWNNSTFPQLYDQICGSQAPDITVTPIVAAGGIFTSDIYADRNAAGQPDSLAGANRTTLHGEVNMQVLPVFQNNAAALAAYMKPGDTYRTGGDPDIIAVVH